MNSGRSATRRDFIEEGPGHLDMTRHSDTPVGVRRFAQQLSGFFVIVASGAIDQHHRVEAAYLRLFELIGKTLGLLRRDPKVVLSVFILTCRCCGNPGDRLRETREAPKRYRTGGDKFTNQRIELAGLRSFADDVQALDYQGQHPPRAPNVFLTEDRQAFAPFIENRQRAIAITGVSHLSKKRSLTESPNRSTGFEPTGGLCVR